MKDRTVFLPKNGLQQISRPVPTFRGIVAECLPHAAPTISVRSPTGMCQEMTMAQCEHAVDYDLPMSVWLAYIV